MDRLEVAFGERPDHLLGVVVLSRVYKADGVAHASGGDRGELLHRALVAIRTDDAGALQAEAQDGRVPASALRRFPGDGEVLPQRWKGLAGRVPAIGELADAFELLPAFTPPARWGSSP